MYGDDIALGIFIVIPYLSFDGGVHIEFFTLIHLSDVSALGAIAITMCFTLFFGWLQGYIVVKSGLPSFIVTLGGLFFLRGSDRSILALIQSPARPDQGRNNSYRNSGYQKYYRFAWPWRNGTGCSKALPEAELKAIAEALPADKSPITEKLEYTYQRIADAKTDIMAGKRGEAARTGAGKCHQFW